MNVTSMIGRLGRDPELRDVGSTKVAKFSVALSEKFKDRNGEKQERTSWIDVEAWGAQAEFCAKWLRKGARVGVQGKLQQDTWETDAGEKRSKVFVRAFNLTPIDWPEDGGGGRGGQRQSYSSPQPAKTYGGNAYADAAGVPDSDLPF